MPKKKLLFIHDRLPAEGISGMIVFLRHFKALKDWEIHILVPENAFQQQVADQYPANFFVHTFVMRKTWWPPFREQSALSVKVRLLLLEKYFNSFITRIQPDVVVTVLYHYYSVAAARISSKLDIKLITFLHDCWDNKSPVEDIRQTRLSYANEVIKASNVLLPVTSELVSHYDKNKTNVPVFPPIPAGFHPAVAATKATIGYAGTVEGHHISLFEKILPVLATEGFTLLVVTNETQKLDALRAQHDNIEVHPAFDTNNEVLKFLAEQAGSIIVNYGLNYSENPNAAHSFPSKFIEFVHLGLPIIAVAPPESPFYKFLEEHNWPLILSEPLEPAVKTMLQAMADAKADHFFRHAGNSLAATVFDPQQIQKKFEEYLNN